MGFLRFLLITILVYYVLRWVFRFLFRMFFANISDNYASSTKYSKAERRKEGEVHIDKIPKQKKHIDKDKGEFVDFEEIK